MSGFDGSLDVVRSSVNDTGLHRNIEFENHVVGTLQNSFNQLAAGLPQLISKAVADGVHHARSEIGLVR